MRREEQAAARAAGVIIDHEPDPDVKSALDKGRGDVPRGTLRNMQCVLASDPRWVGRLRWSLLDHCVFFDGRPLRDTDLTKIAIWLDEAYGVRGSSENLNRAIEVVAEHHSFHPVRDWLDVLSWDGTPRLDRLLITYFGASDTPLHRRFGAAFMIGACARAFRPGCQLDTMLVLIGDQGIGKSNGVAALLPDRRWLGETPFDIGDKDAFMAINGKVVYEMAEFESLARASPDAAKAFVSSRIDRYRAPYARLSADHPRQVVLVVTTNNEEVLKDPTGARRYWPARVGPIDVDAIVRDREQLWAEALARFRAGEIWHLDGDYPRLLREAQREFEVVEAWEALRGRRRRRSGSSPSRHGRRVPTR